MKTIGWLVMGLFFLSGLGGAQAEGMKSPCIPTPLALDDNGGTGPLRGLVVASQEAILSSELAGRILEIRREVRQSFKAGEVLVRFHCPDREARLKKAKAQLEGINQRLAVHRKLVELRSTSTLDVELLEAERLGAVAEVAIQQAEVEKCVVNAPFAGTVAERLVKSFESVNAGQPLLDIVGDAPFEIHIILPSNLLSEIKVGTPVIMMVDETKGCYQARVIRMGGRVNPAGQTILVVAGMTGEKGDLIPGMSGAVVFEAEVPPGKIQKPGQ
ncbi:MAG: efflux RND transporter periplasmic adaptor subunit [Magnetococcales bacterium]|nr:efflux RND transporter periplasmic adaptor subunit [Magnetococcales bacterium]